MVDVRSEINFCDSIAAMALVRSEPNLTDANFSINGCEICRADIGIT